VRTTHRYPISPQPALLLGHRDRASRPHPKRRSSEDGLLRLLRPFLAPLLSIGVEYDDTGLVLPVVLGQGRNLGQVPLEQALVPVCAPAAQGALLVQEFRLSLVPVDERRHIPAELLQGLGPELLRPELW